MMPYGKAIGPDGISDTRFHEDSNYRYNIYSYVCDIFNGKEQYPTNHQTARLMLLVKKPDKPSNLDNLRPIAIAGVVIKVIECVVLHLS